MRKTILAVVLAAVPVVALGAAYEITIEQRNASNTGWLQRIPANPPGANNGMFWIDGSTKQLKWVTPIGATYDDINNTLTFTGASIQSDWNATTGPSVILNKPTLSAVATSGAYSSLTGLPTIPAAQVQTDWNAVSGMGALLNKPSLSAVATSGSYNDLSNKPSIPAAQVQSDWAAVSGVSMILNKPSLGAAAITNNYWDLDNLPPLFEGTWDALQDKPSTFAPSAHTHATSDIVSGTLADARIPSLAISKTTGLQAALDAKFAAPAGSTSQYVRGDGSLATLPSATPYAIGAPSTKSMTLGTGVQCADNTKPCVITITLQAQSSISLSGAVNNEGQVVLGPTSAVGSGTGTVIGRYVNNLGGTLVVGLNISSSQANSYTVMVPTGYWVAARQSAGSGLTIVSAFEQLTQ